MDDRCERVRGRKVEKPQLHLMGHRRRGRGRNNYWRAEAKQFPGSRGISVNSQIKSCLHLSDRINKSKSRRLETRVKKEKKKSQKLLDYPPRGDRRTAGLPAAAAAKDSKVTPANCRGQSLPTQEFVAGQIGLQGQSTDFLGHGKAKGFVTHQTVVKRTVLQQGSEARPGQWV